MPFVTFEGVEGCGKSTQLRRAASRLRESGRAVLETREPGGTDVGERIRAILMDVALADLDPVSEWLLLEADRRQHVEKVLMPAVRRGDFTLCDRYSDSTEAYQQAGRGIAPDAIALVDTIARDGLMPDLTLVYDLDPAAGLSRARARDGSTGRFEGADLAFHKRVRDAFLDIARREPERVRVIAAQDEPEKVFARTWLEIAARFAL